MFEWVDHTAELELRIEAATEAAIFADAARALSELLDEPESGGGESPMIVREIALEAPDRARLLADWLDELAFLAETEGFVVNGVESVRAADRHLRAVVGGRLGSPRHLVKAITYHRLAFEAADGGGGLPWCSMSERAPDSGPADRARPLGATLWEIPASARPGMRVPARVFADPELMQALRADRALEQLENVATLPGVVDAVLAMPDVHQGYGFPVGGVAATAGEEAVISPGGVGDDINCGVRLLALPCDADELGARRERLVHEIARAVPAGAGREATLELRGPALDRVLVDGSQAVVRGRGLGVEEDLERSESGGRLDGADPECVSSRARERGARQLGTLGSGNHFIEVQAVDRIHLFEAAATFGLGPAQVAVLIHSGSRGLGHQVCTDYVRRMDSELSRFGIELPDRQLSCAPIASPEGRAYLAAMAAAANFAWANRQVIADGVRRAVARVLGDGAATATVQVYDVAHNVAKFERYGEQELCVHRKGATRAFPPGSPDIPAAYRDAGQPVFVPGSMGTSSYVLAGRPGSVAHAFGSTCHGAGRRLSRTAARRQIGGAELRRSLEADGVVVRCASNRGLAEEAPFAYKDVHRVVEIVEQAGLAQRVVSLRPLGVVKG